MAFGESKPAAHMRPWWFSPVPIVFGAVIVLASAWVLMVDQVFPPKPVDPRNKLVLPSDTTFCDPAPPLPTTRPK